MSKRSAPTTPSKKAKAGLTLNLNNALDKAHEAKSLKELVDTDVSAIQGVGPKTVEMLNALHIKTIGQLATFKFYVAAKAIVALAELEEKGADKRPAGAASNINKLVDKEWENKSFNEIADAPPSAFQGLAEWVDSTLAPAHITTIRQLAAWKHAHTAESIVALAQFEE